MGAHSHHHNQQVILKRCEWRKKNEFFRMRVECGTICFRHCCGHSDFLKRERRQFIGFNAYWFLSIFALLLLFLCFVYLILFFFHFVQLFTLICKPNESTPRPHYTLYMAVFFFWNFNWESQIQCDFFFSFLFSFFYTKKKQIKYFHVRCLLIWVTQWQEKQKNIYCIADWASGQTIGFNTI